MKNYPSQKVLISIYEKMVKIRAFEEEIARRWPEQEMRSPPHFYAGQEAIASAVCTVLKKEDQVVGNYRGHGYYLAKGGNPHAFVAEMYCKSTGANRGKGGSMLLSSPEVGYIGSSAIVAGGIPIATGLALAAKMKKETKVVVCFFGDAATEEGVFYESINFAALKKLPILFVCENNFYAVTTHISKRQAKPDNIFKHPKVFGIHAVKIDGNDPISVYHASKEAVDGIKVNKGPYFIEAITYRLYQHVGDKYDHVSGQRTKEEFDRWMKKDPILRLQRLLLKKKMITHKTVSRLKLKIDLLIRESFDFAKKSAFPRKKDLLTNVYA